MSHARYSTWSGSMEIPDAYKGRKVWCSRRALRLIFAPRAALLAENLFLRKQLALFQERRAKAHRTTRGFRLAMVTLARFFDWRNALVIVKSAMTFLRWHCNVFRLVWRWKSRKYGRPSLPPELRQIIQRFGRENPTWGEERVANELFVKFEVRVSPSTVERMSYPKTSRLNVTLRYSRRRLPMLSASV